MDCVAAWVAVVCLSQMKRDGFSTNARHRQSVNPAQTTWEVLPKCQIRTWLDMVFLDQHYVRVTGVYHASIQRLHHGPPELWLRQLDGARRFLLDQTRIKGRLYLQYVALNAG
jgi:hypothetical protein